MSIDTSVFVPVVMGDHWDAYDSHKMGMFDVRDARDNEEPDAYRVPVTTWGDYTGSTVTRSNWRSLLREYPQHFKSVDGDYDSHYLIVRESSLLKDDGWFIDQLTALAQEYPVWDEQDVSELEQEIYEEVWEHTLAGEVEDGVHGLIAERSDAKWADVLTPNTQVLYDRLGELMSDSGHYPECENAVSCYVPDLERHTKTIAAALLDEYAAQFNPTQSEVLFS